MKQVLDCSSRRALVNTLWPASLVWRIHAGTIIECTQVEVKLVASEMYDAGFAHQLSSAILLHMPPLETAQTQCFSLYDLSPPVY